MGIENFNLNVPDQVPENGPIPGFEKEYRGAKSEQEIKAISEQIRKSIFDDIGGMAFTLHNMNTGADARVVATGKKDGQGYFFVKEEGSGHSTLANERMILQSKEARERIKAMLGEEGLSEEEREKVVENLALYPN